MQEKIVFFHSLSIFRIYVFEWYHFVTTTVRPRPITNSVHFCRIFATTSV